jgi:hypothetical protein
MAAPRACRALAGFLQNCSAILGSILDARAGAVAVYVGLTIPLFVGAAGLAVDLTSWYRAKRNIQSAADAAAFAAALNLAQQGLDETPDLTAIQAAANDAAARNGVTAPVIVNSPPASGLAAGDPQSIEVIATDPAAMFFAGSFLGAAPQITARSVAKAVVADACIWSLHPSERGALTVAGNAEVNLDCGVVVNSDHPEAALEENGSACLTATSVTVAGFYSGNCVSPEPEIFAPAYGDPLSSLQPPAFGACDNPPPQPGQNGGPTVYSPGVYCNGIHLGPDEFVFEPGLYVLVGDELRINASAVVTNEEDGSGGVTFYLTGSGSDYATIHVNGGAQVTLTPMTTGPLANVLFFQDPAAPADGESLFNGGSTMNLTGILYFPSQSVEFTGGSSVEEARVLLVANLLKFSGNSYLDADYASSVLPQAHYARLVE